MCAMFHGAESFNQPLNNWDVSNIKNMRYMFKGATSFDQPIGSWNASNVTNMSFSLMVLLLSIKTCLNEILLM
ncbi:hypothetical protein MCCG_0421 [Mycoplasma capricolum subsp. capripneumoniae 87001]|uniref:BspA family leucine-rich repeat surface protein n=1 Tax=Mycoplasma capricolum subsp. capripneumoniae 87001 TaxID=1124992 RepID=A0A9N7BJ56_MYCCC|nr:hypothetical protein MCCG_0421 [Mycoplasma capricolum subsp. capripneumoniae 87001]